jgi:hypothetical protein
MIASYSFPTHLLILFDLLLLLAAAAVALAAPGFGRSWWRRLDRFARPPRRAVLAVAAVAVAGQGVVFAVLGPPVPRVTDEFAYLLAADTFASGRLANPSHPCWRVLDVHSLQWPTYAAKYPPAQGLLLAAGQVLAGSPAAGLALAAGLLAAAVTWMLQAWVPARWALLGGLLVVLRLAVGSYWNQSYWGGSAAAIGGALVFSAVRRLGRETRRRHVVALGTGLAILAASRPFEGLLVVLPVAATLWVWTVRRRAFLLRAALPLAGLLLVLAAAMASYNARLTGDPRWFPHLFYQATYNTRPDFVFQASQGPGHPRQLGEVPAAPFAGDWRAVEGDRVAGAFFDRLAKTVYFFAGFGLVPALLAVSGRIRRDAWLRLPLASCGLVILGQSLTSFWFPHYAAPLAAPFWILAIAGLRRLNAGRRRGRRSGRALATALAAGQAVLFVAQVPAHRADAGDWSRWRVEIERRLRAVPGKDLVVMSRPGDWINNAADLDAAPVVWARDLGPEENRSLVECFPDRRVWRLDGVYPPATGPDLRAETSDQEGVGDGPPSRSPRDSAGGPRGSPPGGSRS